VGVNAAVSERIDNVAGTVLVHPLNLPPQGCPRFRHRTNRISSPASGSWRVVARARSVAGYAIPAIVVFFFWVVVVILAIILLAFIVHWAGGGVLNLRLGHFILNVGFT
jgi:hypothetical protein